MPDTSTPSDEEVADAVRPALRYGWLAKGLLFVIIGILAVDIARRRYPSEDADQTGALATIADAPAGRVLVVTVSAGLALYAAWQLLSAISGRVRWSSATSSPEDALDLLRRVGWAGLALVYGLLAVTGIQIVLHDRSAAQDSGGGPTSPTGLTARLFDVPGGRAVVVAIGIGTAIVGLYQLHKGLTGAFLDDIRTEGLSDTARGALRTVGTAGFGARALLLGIAGWLFVDAALTYDPDRAAGLDDSLRTLATAPHGRVLLFATGLGLASAGAYDMITYRRQRLGDEG